METFTKKEVKKDLIEFEVILQILRILERMVLVGSHILVNDFWEKSCSQQVISHLEMSDERPHL